MEQFQQAFIGRVAALSKTHSLLTDDNRQVVSFRLLLKNELEPFENGSDRVLCEGADILLPADLAVPLGMAIHELTTNAVKYGALAELGARLTIKWAAKDGRLVFDWCEENLLNVKPPQHTGFGSQLLQRVLPQQVGAETTLDYRPDGLKANFSIPLGSST
jgi:two-component sensor histidine kinase